MTALAALLAWSPVIAQTQVPNVFQSGTPALAGDVNANFATLEDAANQNALDSAANAVEIQTNQVGIQANAADLITAAGQAGLRVYSQGQSIGWFLSSVSASPLNNSIYMISDTGYLFEGRWYDPTSDRYLTQAAYYFSDPGCTGTVYIDLSNRLLGVLGSVVRPLRDATAAQYGNYYVPRGSSLAQTTVLSQEANIAGDCLDSLATRNFYQALPNDESVTGVPDIEPPLPYTIGVP